MLNKKAEDLSILDVRKLASFTDFFIICSARSSRQVQAVAEETVEKLKELGFRPLGREGLKDSEWVLLDYGDVIIHIFLSPAREFYDLEGFWSEAERIPATA